MVSQIKNLEENDLKKLRDFEKKIGCCVVALEPQPRPAKLSEAQLKDLKALEGDMDAILVAYKCG